MKKKSISQGQLLVVKECLSKAHAEDMAFRTSPLYSSILVVRNLIVLDEPASSIDPIEEIRLYKYFKELSKGKTSIIVTHKIGSAKIADRIIVMDYGEILEYGTHESLIKANGLYAKMFETQAQWYIS